MRHLGERSSKYFACIPELIPLPKNNFLIFPIKNILVFKYLYINRNSEAGEADTNNTCRTICIKKNIIILGKTI